MLAPTTTSMYRIFVLRDLTQLYSPQCVEPTVMTDDVFPDEILWNYNITDPSL